MPRKKSKRPHVLVLKKAGWEFYKLRYRDPVTGKETLRSTETKIKREAEREAIAWEEQLAATATAAVEIPWAEFSIKFKRGHLAGLKPHSESGVERILNLLKADLKPEKLSDLTSQKLTEWVILLRSRGHAEATLVSYLQRLKTALRWAETQGMLAKMPNFPRLKKIEDEFLMKGRPLTLAEFHQLLAAVPHVVTEKCAADWRRALWAIWLSALRLDEMIEFCWDDPTKISLTERKGRFYLWIPGSQEKAGKNRILPIAPDFEEWLRKTPPADRHGPVVHFAKQKQRKGRGGERPTMDWVSKTISKIGKAAGIVVSTKGGKTKYASAHDLRRSFAERWVEDVDAIWLQALMRHADIKTTQKYYLSKDAAKVGDVLARAHKSMQQRGDGLGDTRHLPENTDDTNQDYVI